MKRLRTSKRKKARSRTATQDSSLVKSPSFLLILIAGIFLSVIISAINIPVFQNQTTPDDISVPEHNGSDVQDVTTASSITTTSPAAFTKKTYTNTTYGYSFEYLESSDPSMRHNFFTDDTAEINGTDSLIIKVEPTKQYGSDIQKWFTGQSIEPYTGKPMTCFDRQYTSEIKSLYDNTKTVIRFPQTILMLDNFREANKSDARCHDRGQVRILVIPHDDFLVTITYDWAIESEKVLSSFRFTK